MEDIKYRFIATGRTGQREVFPKNGNTLVVSWGKEKENALFRKTLKGKITFSGDDFHWLEVFERSQYRCDPITLSVQKKCGSEYTEFFLARLILNKGDWDFDQCKCEIEADVEDRYSCYNDAKDTEYNLFSFIYAGQIINLLQGEIESINCSGTTGDPQWCGTDEDLNKGWVIQSLYTETTSDVGGEQNTFQINYVREVITSSIPLMAPWINIGNGQYAKPPALYGYRSYGGQNYFGYDYQVGGSIDHGMKLKDVFTMFINQSCSSLTLKSNFFNWNTNNPDSINYVTGQPSKVSNLILFQKSDVKRPSTSNNATQANITFEKILKDICNMFQLKWDIDEDDNFIIEHVSFFQKGLGLNLVGRSDARLRLGTSRYTYDVDNMPRKETFTMMDTKYTYGDFKGAPIVYSNSCVGQGDNDNIEYAVENIMTDVSLALNNPDSNSSIVSDDGFVLIACDENNNMLSEATIFNGNILNNTLSWARLHLDYWRHERVFQNFTMNNVQTEALSVVPTKKQVKINVQLCCGDVFDPEQLVQTTLGNGQVSEADFGLYSEILSLTLMYIPEENLNVNIKPNAVNDVAVTFVNLTIDIDVLINDSDEDGTINPATLEILFGGSNGTSSIVDGKIRYTPNLGYTGGDLISYRVSDDFAEPSNTANVNITVKPGSPVAVANPDSFRTAKNANLIIGNVLSNDSGDGAISAVAETKATTNGGSVTINANGSFTYTPPANFLGNDQFTYTVQDAAGHSAIGTATVEVFEKEPVYVRYTETNYFTQDLMETCTPGDGGSGFPKRVGDQSTVTQNIKFYSDAAGTIPLNVNNYGFAVKLQSIINSNTGSNTSVQDIIPTSSEIIYPGMIKEYNYNGCNGTLDLHQEIIYSLISSPDYIIL